MKLRILVALLLVAAERGTDALVMSQLPDPSPFTLADMEIPHATIYSR